MAELNLRWLRYFLALGEEPHFRRAAQKLHITQPVLSRQIRLLERELYVELVARDGNPVELTAAGRKLLRNVEVERGTGINFVGAPDDSKYWIVADLEIEGLDRGYWHQRVHTADS
jgi:DNA-binding MarR family transcriptional regulator